MTLSCMDCLQLRSPTTFENWLLDADQKFYVRVVPVYNGGKAGVPAIPVKVTVQRPHPCPSASSDVVVKLPSAAIVWYMRPNFGGYADHWYYPWSYPYGDEFHPQYSQIWNLMQDFVVKYVGDMLTIGWCSDHS
jgi:hypothetical protein